MKKACENRNALFFQDSISKGRLRLREIFTGDKLLGLLMRPKSPLQYRGLYLTRQNLCV